MRIARLRRVSDRMDRMERSLREMESVEQEMERRFRFWRRLVVRTGWVALFAGAAIAGGLVVKVWGG